MTNYAVIVNARDWNTRVEYYDSLESAIASAYKHKLDGKSIMLCENKQNMLDELGFAMHKREDSKKLVKDTTKMLKNI